MLNTDNSYVRMDLALVIEPVVINVEISYNTED